MLLLCFYHCCIIWPNFEVELVHVVAFVYIHSILQIYINVCSINILNSCIYSTGGFRLIIPRSHLQIHLLGMIPCTILYNKKKVKSFIDFGFQLWYHSINQTLNVCCMIHGSVVFRCSNVIFHTLVWNKHCFKRRLHPLKSMSSIINNEVK